MTTRKPFSNATMRQPVPGKPHLALVAGWWRVSPMPKPYHKHSLLWRLAHDFVNQLNKEQHPCSKAGLIDTNDNDGK